MPLNQLQVGPVPASDGTPVTARGGKAGEAIVQELHGRYYEQTYRGNVFSASNQATVSVGVGLSTTVATLSLSNDSGSGKNLALLNASYAFATAPAAAAVVFLAGQFNAGTNVTHTTAVTVRSNFLNTSAQAVGKVDTVATLPTVPVVFDPLVSIEAASAITPPVVSKEYAGSIIIPPGGYVVIQGNAAAAGFCSFTWEENNQ